MRGRGVPFPRKDGIGALEGVPGSRADFRPPRSDGSVRAGDAGIGRNVRSRELSRVCRSESADIKSEPFLCGAGSTRALGHAARPPKLGDAPAPLLSDASWSAGTVPRPAPSSAAEGADEVGGCSGTAFLRSSSTCHITLGYHDYTILAIPTSGSAITTCGSAIKKQMISADRWSCDVPSGHSAKVKR